MSESELISKYGYVRSRHAPFERPIGSTWYLLGATQVEIVSEPIRTKAQYNKLTYMCKVIRKGKHSKLQEGQIYQLSACILYPYPHKEMKKRIQNKEGRV